VNEFSGFDDGLARKAEQVANHQGDLRSIDLDHRCFRVQIIHHTFAGSEMIIPGQRCAGAGIDDD
jgi:hypothetical protein